MYNKLRQKDIDALTNEKNNGTRKHNILDVLNNVNSIFDGLYFHYKDVPKEIIFERSIAERSKLRRERLAKIKKRTDHYQTPSSMCQKLKETEGAVNEFQVDSVKKVLSKLQRIIGYILKDDVFKIEENEKITDIVERILELNNKIQSGQGLKILAPNQMLSRLPISLAQLKQEVILKNSKTELGNYCILCTDQKNLQKMFTKVWLTFFKQGNNLYEQWK